MTDPDYDEIEQLIDNDPIELGRRLRLALAEVAQLEGLLRRAANCCERPTGVCFEAKSRWFS